MLGLDMLADVYARGAGGAYTTVSRTSLACRLVYADASRATGSDRTELLSRATLYHDPSYTMPERAQLLINGERWNVEAGSLTPVRGPSGSRRMGKCDVRRAV